MVYTQNLDMFRGIIYDTHKNNCHQEICRHIRYQARMLHYLH